jgi:hypothetical protein
VPCGPDDAAFALPAPGGTSPAAGSSAAEGRDGGEAVQVRAEPGRQGRPDALVVEIHAYSSVLAV